MVHGLYAPEWCMACMHRDGAWLVCTGMVHGLCAPGWCMAYVHRDGAWLVCTVMVHGLYAHERTLLWTINHFTNSLTVSSF